jgi:NAD(P)-dependent dehydrogenase (short-subunit alcohol dehydrogenase family)
MQKKIILITGASSGIGLATALYFAGREGWHIAATMRNPAKAPEQLKGKQNISLYRLDVTDMQSIEQAIEQCVQQHGVPDILVNNAGYGAVGIFEAATPQQVQDQFNTNVFGTMNTIRALLPYFRQRRQGTIINITSMGGRITFPIYSVYHATKWAVEGFSESLAFELRPFNIAVKIVEPGAIKTDFYDRSMDLFRGENLQDYDEYTDITYKNTQQAGKDAPGPEIVAATIYKAATDNSTKLRYPAGSNAPLLLLLRRILPEKLFMGIVRSVVEKGFKR